MSGTPFAYATYVLGDTNIGLRRMAILFVHFNTYLAIQERYGQKRYLQSIPWTNIEVIKWGVQRKSGGALLASDLLSWIPLIGDITVGQSEDDGFYLHYIDNESGSIQTPFFATGSRLERRDKVIHRILAYRDDFNRGISSRPGPDRR